MGTDSRIDLHVYHHNEPSKTDKETIRLLKLILKKEQETMATLADLKAQVEAEETVQTSLITLLTGLADQVKNLAPTQAAIDELAAKIQADTDTMSAAVVANTPVA